MMYQQTRDLKFNCFNINAFFAFFTDQHLQMRERERERERERQREREREREREKLIINYTLTGICAQCNCHRRVCLLCTKNGHLGARWVERPRFILEEVTTLDISPRIFLIILK